MLDNEAVQKIITDVRANIKRLTECPGPHEFESICKEGYPAPKEYRCKKCNGTVGSIQRLWYACGLEHGKIADAN